VTTATPARIGTRVDNLTLRGRLIDPAADRDETVELAIEDGIVTRVTAIDDGTSDGLVIAPGFVDLHAHLREPGNEDAETVATGLAAAAHGGFTTVCAMPNTTPPADESGVVGRVLAAAAASGSPVRVLPYGCVSAGRAGETLAAMGELADAGVVGFSDDGSPIGSPALLRSALLYSGALGLPVVEHPEDLALTVGAEAHEGYVATVLGLAGWPVAAEVSAIARALAVLADVVGDEPRARLHVTHVSTRASLALIREAKARGLPVTCDVTPHHMALSDEWIAGARRWAWDAIDGHGARDPWADGALVAAPFDASLRVNPPLRSAEDAVACLAAVVDGTADAIGTDHAPHTSVDKDVEFGLAANGISGLETALGIGLAAVDAGRLALPQLIRALTKGPAAVLGDRSARAPGIAVGEPADLVVFDPAGSWHVTADSLASKGKNTPLLGRELHGVVRLTVADGRVAWSG
jgi:dihydroorotase